VAAEHWNATSKHINAYTHAYTHAHKHADISIQETIPMLQQLL